MSLVETQFSPWQPRYGVFGHFVTCTVFLILSLFRYDYRVVLFLSGVTGERVQQKGTMGWLPIVRGGFSPSQWPHHTLCCQSLKLISVILVGVYCSLTVSACISLMTMRLSTFPYVYGLFGYPLLWSVLSSLLPISLLGCSFILWKWVSFFEIAWSIR